jgi:hypothetical protein
MLNQRPRSWDWDNTIEKNKKKITKYNLSINLMLYDEIYKIIIKKNLKNQCQSAYSFKLVI